MRSFDPAAVAAALLRDAVQAVEPVASRGRNASVWQVRMQDGRRYALKHYPAQDAVDRLTAETAALRFMQGQGIDSVPEVVTADPSRAAVLLHWIDGVQALPAEAAGVDACLAFLARLHGARGQGGDLPPAREACWTGAELLRQVEMRLQRLRDIAAEEPLLRDFLEGPLEPLRRDAARRTAGVATLAAQRSLSPSDIGLHNALRGPDGRLTFLDFEYFGWDDPVKLTADVMLHPGMALDDDLAGRFRAGAERIYGADPDFPTRLDALLPVYALRWSLILLNEFLPERWAARRAAGMTDDHWAVKAAQLAKAETMLTKVAA